MNISNTQSQSQSECEGEGAGNPSLLVAVRHHILPHEARAGRRGAGRKHPGNQQPRRALPGLPHPRDHRALQAVRGDCYCIWNTLAYFCLVFEENKIYARLFIVEPLKNKI